MEKLREAGAFGIISSGEGRASRFLFRLVQFTLFCFFFGLTHAMASDSSSTKMHTALQKQDLQLNELTKTSEGLSSSAVQQQKTITGKVKDNTGVGLPGVSVVLKGTSIGVITEMDGKYSLSNVPENATLQFSFVGMKSQEVKVGTQTLINVVLADETIGIEEVVAVGYGTTKKKDITGSVSSVKAEDMTKSAVNSLDQGLSGRSAGVQVTTQSGQPGGATSLRIRGISSINSANEPLYVIDGFPYYNDNNATQGNAISGAPALNMLSTLNTGDIESIEVLKDASATAIYGARGANGVIMITTKRGKTGKAKIEFETYSGVQKVSKIIPLLNAKQYAQFRNDAYVDARGLNGTGLPTYTTDEIASMGEGTNWQNEIFRTAPISNYQVSATGGNEDLRYSISGSYFDQDGIVIGSNLKRFTGRVNIDARLTKRLSIGNNFTISRINSDLANTGGGTTGTNGNQGPSSSNIIEDALFFNPVIPVYDQTGAYVADNNTGTALYAHGTGNKTNTPNQNPVATANLATLESITSRLLENIFAEYEILSSLKFRSSFGIDYLFNRQNSFMPSTVINGVPGGIAAIGTANTLNWLTENTLTFNKQFGVHSLQALAGFSAQKSQTEYLSMSGRTFPTDVVNVYNMATAGVADPSNSNYLGWSMMSYLGRLNYGYKDKYLATVSLRADGSSKFGKNNKYGYFPSAALAWKIHEGAFMKRLKVFDEFKLRLSAGTTGNQEIPAYQSLSGLGVLRYPISNTTPSVGLSPNRLGNPDIKWESTSQVDAGLDIAFFHRRVSLTLDAYYKTTKDLLLFVQVPFSSGFETVLQNIGSVENKGLEGSVQTVNVDKLGFLWKSSFNIAFNRNKVTNFGNEKERYIGSDYNLFKGQATSVIRVGEPLGNFVGYINDGIIKNQAELDKAPKSGYDYIGSRRYVDLNGDGKINDADRAIIGNALPKFTGGFQNTLSYKNISLDFFFQFVYGNDIYNMTQVELEFLNGRQNQSITVLDRFKPGVNENTDVARAGNPEYTYFRQSNSRWIEDGSFIRMKNVTLAYDMPLKKWNVNWLSSARIYFNGQNLWLLSKYRGYDPEVNVNSQSNTLLGFDYCSYPSAKTYTFGLKIGF